MTQLGNFLLQCYFNNIYSIFHNNWIPIYYIGFNTITHDAINKIQWKNMDK